MAHWKVKDIALQTFITALLPNKKDTVKKKLSEPGNPNAGLNKNYNQFIFCSPLIKTTLTFYKGFKITNETETLDN